VTFLGELGGRPSISTGGVGDAEVLPYALDAFTVNVYNIPGWTIGIPNDMFLLKFVKNSAPPGNIVTEYVTLSPVIGASHETSTI